MKTHIYIIILLIISVVPGIFADSLSSPDQLLPLEQISISSVPTTEYIDDFSKLSFSIYDENSISAFPEDGSIMAVIRSEFTIDTTLKNEDICLYIPPLVFPTVIYINGNQIYRFGSIDPYVSTIYATECIYLPRAFLNFGQKNILDIQVVPSGRKPVLQIFHIACYANGVRASFWRSFVSSKLITALSVVAFILSIYFMFIYLINPEKEIVYFLFGLVCVSFFLAYVEISFAHGYGNEMLLKKISKSGFIGTVASFFFFCMEFTGLPKRKKIPYILVGLASAVLVILHWMSPDMYSIEKVYTIVTSYYFGPILLACLIILLFAVIRKKQKEAIPVLVGLSGVAAAAGHDIIYISMGKQPFAYLTAYGFIWLLIWLFFMLSTKQAQIAKTVILSSEEIREKNKEQTRMIQQIKETVESLSGASDRLSDRIGSSKVILEKTDKDIHGIQTNINTRFSGLEETISNIKNRMDTSTQKISSALEHQIISVGEINTRMNTMSNHMGTILEASSESHQSATHLDTMAKNSNSVIGQTNQTIKKIQNYSSFLQSVLTAIEDLTERTSLLSINAAIEAARAGSSGQGFSVVASEVRNLSARSKDQLNSSFEQINDMSEAINMSTALSEEVTSSINQMITQIEIVNQQAEKIQESLTIQQNETTLIGNDLDQLSWETQTVDDITRETQKEDTQMSERLEEVRVTLGETQHLLGSQIEAMTDLTGFVQDIGDEVILVMEEVKKLRESIIER